MVSGGSIRGVWFLGEPQFVWGETTQTSRGIHGQMQARKASGSVTGGVEDSGKEQAEMARPVESPQNKCRSLQQNLYKALD